MRSLLILSILALFTGCATLPPVEIKDEAPSIDTRPVADDVRSESRFPENVSREPMWYIPMFTGNRDDSNPQALVSWWRDDNPDAVNNFVEKIREGYELGARRFFINRPMGTNGWSHVSAASWLTMSDEKRADLPIVLHEFYKETQDDPIAIVWFIGSEMRSAVDLAGWHPAGDTEYYMLGDETDPWHLRASQMTLGGWISTGAYGLFIDHSSPPDERDHFIRLSKALQGWPFYMAIGGEALPGLHNEAGALLRHDDGTMQIDPDAITAMSWVATSVYFDHPTRAPLGTRTESYPFDPETTRVFEWIQGNLTSFGETEQDNRDYIRQRMRDGLIPITNRPAMFDEAMQIYLLTRTEK